MLQKLKGTQDILPKDVKKWQRLEEVLHSICEYFNYGEIRTPIFERSELFKRTSGESSDIVSKEMYEFTDRGKRNIALRPEGTAPVVRSYIENKLFADRVQPQKFYYIGPMFRYERPQKGRYRQFHQFGVENIGILDPSVDAEVISLTTNIFKLLGLKGVKVNINSLGDKESREIYKKAIVEHFEKDIDNMCNDCKERLNSNPLRILDCKVDSEHEAMLKAPKMIDHLNIVSKKYFDDVLEMLDTLSIDYNINDKLVRGLDYYTHTVFEVEADIEGFGAQNVLCGGGRYDKLIESLNGPKTPAIGVAFGMERVLLALESEGINITEEESIDSYVIILGDNAKFEGVNLVNSLRLNGFKTEFDPLRKGLKAQFRSADRLNPKTILILGEDEIKNNIVNVKFKGKEEKVKLDLIIDYLDGIIGG